MESIINRLPWRDVTSAAQVSQHFSHHATNRIWAELPWSDTEPWGLDMDTVHPSRRQVYASKVRSLVLSSSRRPAAPGHHGLRFHNLRHLRLCEYGLDAHSRPPLAPYLASDRLWNVTLEDCAVDAALLGTLAPRCRRLRELCLERDHWPAAAPREPRHPNWRGDGVFVFPAMLRRLELRADTAALTEAFERLAPLTPDSSQLVEAVLSPTTVSLLSSLDTTSPGRVVLNVPRWPSWVIMEPLLLFKHLTHLFLEFNGSNVSLRAPQMMLLCELPALTNIGIRRCPFIAATADDIRLELSVAQFTAWISHFPALRTLKLGARAPDPYDEALIALGTVCRQLVNCQWPGLINFSSLQLDSREDCLFPNLWTFCCPHGARTSSLPNRFPRNISHITELAIILFRHFPILMHFEIENVGQDEGVNAVEHAFNAITGDR
ncbi:hypothetical protein ISF_04114 [Cordyceps fumosorosea ARSEF 2679]|uniref:F-box domain-containing protein n=1 Tax=Cordyceps fumosorosea (strain ARSEF 2679) TaxID=1081104 RepID=A0A167YFX4_CORFA|nr:hypothetical protein ISF_04114 [Cordyceps fumosorosea ARSEF 2679]OAA66276.1 hypothetical protein ISF_04114 [Cordyceps fumosorosea ARSEF 2679]